jgi:hypothetical protein
MRSFYLIVVVGELGNFAITVCVLWVLCYLNSHHPHALASLSPYDNVCARFGGHWSKCEMAEANQCSELKY